MRVAPVVVLETLNKRGRKPGQQNVEEDHSLKLENADNSRTTNSTLECLTVNSEMLGQRKTARNATKILLITSHPARVGSN